MEQGQCSQFSLPALWRSLRKPSFASSLSTKRALRKIFIISEGASLSKLICTKCEGFVSKVSDFNKNVKLCKSNWNKSVQWSVVFKSDPRRPSDPTWTPHDSDDRDICTFDVLYWISSSNLFRFSLVYKRHYMLSAVLLGGVLNSKLSRAARLPPSKWEVI